MFIESEGPFSGLVFVTLFSNLLLFVVAWILVSSQSSATWRWHNVLEPETVGDKTLISVNVDESACKLSPQLPGGLVSLPSVLKTKQFLQFGRRNPVNCRRSAVSLVAFLSDDEEVNTICAQTIVCAKHIIQVWMTCLLNSARSNSILVLRRSSDCVRSNVVVDLISLLREALKQFAGTTRLVLMFDSARIYFLHKG